MRSSARITALIGAGATLEIKGPSTCEITQAICEDSFTQDVKNTLDSFLDPEGRHGARDCGTRQLCARPTTFEDIFDALEGLYSWSSTEPSYSPDFKPRMAAFAQLTEQRWKDGPAILESIKHAVGTIAKTVEHSSGKFDPNGEHQWFAGFFAQHEAWDVATLNYDRIFEGLWTPAAFTDGYDRRGVPPHRFDPQRLGDQSRHRLMHLHGCITLGHLLPRSGDRTASWEDLYQFDDYDRASKTWFNRTQNTAQSGRVAIIGPIITGLQKTDKITAEPYLDYFMQLRQWLRDTPRLLVAGYSFGDLHLNEALRRFARHGSERRIVVVTMIPKELRDYWHYSHTEEYLGGRTLYLLAALGGDKHPVGEFRQYQQPLVSLDGCCHVYVEGMQAALQHHGDHIREFLRS